MMYQNIPQEMRLYNQWIVWRYENDGGTSPTKVPYSPNKQMVHASVSDPQTWSDYDTAVNVAVNNPRTIAGIGFVLTENDPFCFIDLDDTGGDEALMARQRKIYTSFHTYSELSPSRKGLHIIGKAKVQQGRKRSKIEIYSQGRFMTMTGFQYSMMYNTINNVQDIADILWSQMGEGRAAKYYDPNAPELHADTEIMETAANAVDSAKFLDLYAGRWHDYGYPSQSEADQALINIIAFYTQNRPQIKRIFKNSALGLRAKAQRDGYLDYTINKSFDRQLPPIDIEGFAEVCEAVMLRQKMGAGAVATSAPSESTLGALPADVEVPAQHTMPAEFMSSRPDDETLPLHLRMPPPGVTGEIATFMFHQAPRQVREIALAAALGFMSGLCGRAFNISGQGLNQYIFLLAPTGSGKEAMAHGIEKIVRRVMMQVPSIVNYFGPGDFASGQALHRQLENTPCFMSIIGEVDKKIEGLSSKNANEAQLKLRRLMLDLYHKSGSAGELRPTVYSDKAKDTKTIRSPAFTILGEGTPRRFFESLNEGMIDEGLMPRFTVIEYMGKRPVLNEGHVNVQPPEDMVSRIAGIAEFVARLDANNHCVNVNCTSDAKIILDKFNQECDERINNTAESLIVEIWNRAHIKTLRLAAILAVGVNPFQPVIDALMAEFAKSVITYDIANILTRFNQGDIGNDNKETQQIVLTKRKIAMFLTKPYKELISYSVTHNYYDKKVIPIGFFTRALPLLKPFKGDRLGPTIAVKRAIQTCIDEGIIAEIARAQATAMFGSAQKCYAIQKPEYILSLYGGKNK